MIRKHEDNYLIPNWIKLLLGAVVVVVLFSICILIIYSTSLTDGFIPDYPNRDEWGVFGDFFGGVLNPIFGFLSFVALLITIFYQSKELKLSRTELELTREELANSARALNGQNKAIELQSFEQTFFSWCSTYKDLLSSIEGDIYVKDPRLGRTEEKRFIATDFLQKLWEDRLSISKIHRIFVPERSISGNGSGRRELVFSDLVPSEFQQKYNVREFTTDILLSNLTDSVVAEVEKGWSQTYFQYEYKFDALFRTAYKLIVWIDTQPNERITRENKFFYISIFRSQLSKIELIFFFYNGLSYVGEKFKPLIEKYAFFDNLNYEKDDCMKLLASKYKETAFSSDLAKEQLLILKQTEGGIF